MTLLFHKKQSIIRRGLVLIAGLMLLGRIDGFAQEGSVSFAPQSSWNADEPSATFVIRKAPEQKKNNYDPRSFSSDDQTYLQQSVSRPVEVHQPYGSVDQAFQGRTRTDASSGQFQQQRSQESAVSPATYSFDSRDWAEVYPVAGNAGLDSFSSNQVSAMNGAVAPADGGSAIGTTVNGSHGEPNWNWGALNTESQTKVASNIRIVDGSKAETARLPAQPVLDLEPNPKYSKHLKYADVCGVVVVQSNFSLTEIKDLLREIEMLQRDLNLYMAVPAPKEKIELCLFKDEASYIRFLKDIYPKAPQDRRALYVKVDKKPGNLLVQRTKDFEIDLRHEMTHAIIHASIATVPIWLDEGLAKYFEPKPEDRFANNPYIKTVRFNAKFGAVPPLRRLERLEFIDEMGAREYRDSWAWVHFLIHHSPQSHRLLAGYLQLLATLPEQQSNGKKVVIPPIGLYIEDVVQDSKSKYLEHFKTWAVESGDADD